MSYSVAVVGATGAVGSTMIQSLQELNFPVSQLHLLATARSAGSHYRYRDQTVTVQDIENFDFAGVQVALFAGGEIASEKLVPRAQQAGAICIDNSASFRMHANVPLVVPEVNSEALRTHQGIIANPNCSTIQMVAALKPFVDLGLRRVLVSTYQSVSGTGKEAIEELENQTRAWASGQPAPPPRIYPVPIAFNVLPQIGSFGPDGFTGEETKMMEETRKILSLPQLRISATCVRVPVFYGHSESVHIELDRPCSVAQAEERLKTMAGLQVMAAGPTPTPLQAAHQDEVMVGRIRLDPSVENGLQFWVVADNLRKGAASNAVQIACKMLEMKLL
ncbi:aspartate-semialdehyde dehydrogenase [bacterium]|nr:aspartate-semialdehyde dehydrogenase [bacterium]